MHRAGPRTDVGRGLPAARRPVRREPRVRGPTTVSPSESAPAGRAADAGSTSAPRTSPGSTRRPRRAGRRARAPSVRTPCSTPVRRPSSPSSARWPTPISSPAATYPQQRSHRVRWPPPDAPRTGARRRPAPPRRRRSHLAHQEAGARAAASWSRCATPATTEIVVTDLAAQPELFEQLEVLATPVIIRELPAPPAGSSAPARTSTRSSTQLEITCRPSTPTGPDRRQPAAIARHRPPARTRSHRMSSQTADGEADGVQTRRCGCGSSSPASQHEPAWRSGHWSR